MLFTRCPACQTTFRINEEMLRKAGGQVRCGRCSNVFNAHRELRESGDAPKARATPGPSASPSAPAAASPQSAAWPEIFDMPAATTPKLRAVPATDGAPGAERAAEAETPKEPPAAGQSPAEAGLGAPPEANDSVPLVADLWTPTPVAPAQSRVWTVAVALAGLVLLVQVAHSFSAVLATRTTFGPLVQRAYGALGLTLVPRWNLDRYEIVRATAATSPGATGRGDLIVTASIRNRGTRPQPYPHVQLRLLDRWQQTVGKRAFAPADYGARSVTPDVLLDPGASVTAELVVVDPGPDAAGFEIDVCVVGVAGLRCAADDVFE
jgi:predicted Zn finger-like uncharacterized protein